MTTRAILEKMLADHGLRITERDPLHAEILDAAVERWGLDVTMRALLPHVEGDLATYALERVGAALGEEYECPYQLERIEATECDAGQAG